MKTAAQLARADSLPAPSDRTAQTPAQQTQAALAGGDLHAPKKRALLIISADVRPEIQGEIAAGRYPRKDYFALAHALHADILDWPSIDDTRVSRVVGRFIGKAAAQAWLAFRQRRAYQVIYTDSERVGIPLAILLKLARAHQTQHVMLTHLLSPWKKRVWFRWGRIYSHIDTILCHATQQRRIMIEELKIPAGKITLIPYQADEHFWHPMTAEEARASLEEAQTAAADSSAPAPAVAAVAQARASGSGAPAQPMICSVGLEFRDYPTLIEAARDLDVQVEIAAASYWSHHKTVAEREALPPNVHISAHQYLSLRHLYAAARFVVVPLLDVDNQAGITVILEAMAMGKALIVSASKGQTDTVRDRRNKGYGRVERVILPGFLDAPGVAENLGRLPTGFYVKPGDPDELRRAISYLLAHPDVADELGRNGRRVVEGLMGLDAFVTRIVQIIER